MASLIPYRFRTPRVHDFLGEDFFRPFFQETGRECFRVDVSDRGSHYLLEAELPGLTREKIHVDADDGVLTISAENWREEKEGEESYVYSERRTGECSRSFSLNQIDEEQISARYEDGILKVTLPKLDQNTVGRNIEIQ